MKLSYHTRNYEGKRSLNRINFQKTKKFFFFKLFEPFWQVTLDGFALKHYWEVTILKIYFFLNILK